MSKKTLKEEIEFHAGVFSSKQMAHYFEMGAKQGIESFMRRAREMAVRPEPNSVTQFEPFIDIVKLEQLAKEATGE